MYQLIDFPSDNDYNTFEEDERAHSDVDSDDGSETERIKEATEIKEQMYREKRDQIKNQLRQLRAGTLPEFCKKQRKLDLAHKERQRRINTSYNFLQSKFDREQQKEKEAIMKEGEKLKQNLKKRLFAELDEKSKALENERQSMDLNSTTTSADIRVAPRKLRRRANEPQPSASEKRRKEGPSSIQYELSPEEIEDDLKAILAASNASNSSSTSGSSWSESTMSRVEKGKLYHDRTCFQVGHAVRAENHRDGNKLNGTICAISEYQIFVRRSSDSKKMQVPVSLLNRGKFSLKKRANL